MFVFAGWSLLTLISAIWLEDIYYSVFTTWPSLVVTLAIFSFVGYEVQDQWGFSSNSAKAGAWAGALAGFIGAVVGLLVIYFAPHILEASVQQAVAQGADAAFVMQWAKVGGYINLVLAPLFDALIGAAVAALSGWIASKVSK